MTRDFFIERLGEMPQRLAIAIPIALLVYLLPSIIGFIRNIEGKRKLFGLNLFGGWTGLVWFYCFFSSME